MTDSCKTKKSTDSSEVLNSMETETKEGEEITCSLCVGIVVVTLAVVLLAMYAYPE